MISIEKIAQVDRTTDRIFKVPNNYFEELTSSILKQIQIKSESQLNQKAETPFAMPEGYFENLSAKIMGRIGQIEKQDTATEALERVNVFKVPENYFHKLEINTYIERFDKTNVFKVPKGYFENLTNEVLSKISIPTNNIFKVTWWKTPQIAWSAAASLVLIVGMWFSILQFTKNKTELDLEKISNEEIKTYLETQDLSYLEYESAIETAQNSSKNNENKVLDGLKIDKQDILEHLNNQDLEEDI